MKKFCLFFSITLMMLATGCTSTYPTKSRSLMTSMRTQEKVITVAKEKFPAKDPIQVVLYKEGEAPVKPYKIIGVGVVAKYNNGGIKRQKAIIQDKLRGLAGSVGGDAVIEIVQDEQAVKGNIISFQRVLS